jgi:hypothetical protein
MNKSTPPIELLVRNEYLFNDVEGHGAFTKGILVSVRALKNQALQFSVLLETGALFTGLPASALTTEENDDGLSVSDSQMWDNISEHIDVFTIEQLKYMACTVKINDAVLEGQYLFTIDYVGYTDLSAHPEHWKQLHVIALFGVGIVCYPQYRIRFKDKALCARSGEPLPQYRANTTTWTVE